MTKPVQIQRLAMKGFQPEGYPPPLCLPHKRGPYCLYSEAIAHEQAALLQVRSLLEAKAKEWEGTHKWACALDLRALAATLWNQGK